jgi:ABC-2 type transport system permease protein
MSDRGGAHHPLVELTLARMREFWREPEALFWMFGFPVLMALVLGVAFRTRGDDPVVVGVVRAAGDAPIVAALGEGSAITVRGLDADAVDLALQRADVQMVVIPGSPPVYRFDPTRTESRLARRIVDDRLQRAGGRRDVWEATEQHVDARGSRYIDWLVPGLLGMNILSTGVWGVGVGIVVARSRKLLKRLVAAPMRRWQYLLAQVLARLSFLAVEVGALLIFARFVFDVPMRGSMLTLIALSVLGAVSCAGLGLLIASRAKTIEAVNGLMNVVMLPMWILSGVFFSSSNFPDTMQPVIRLLPLTALNDALRRVMLEGASAAAVAGEAGVLAAWGLGSFGLALAIFRWR